MADKKQKIGIFTGYFLPHLGGVERYTDKLSTALLKLGYDVVIITFNEKSVKNHEKLDRRTIYRLPVFSVAKERYPIPRVNAEYKELIKKIENEKIDYFILNTRFHLTSLIGARLGRKVSKPVFLIEHGTDHFSVNNKVLDFFGSIYEHILTEVVKRYVDKFYGVSKNCNIWLKHFGIVASGVFYNAVSARDKRSVKDYYDHKFRKDDIVITYAGRLIKEKGILNLIEAFEKLDKQLNVKLVIAGDGDLLEMIRHKYTYPSSKIELLGRLDYDHVMSLYKRTDIFVHPSLYPEGLPTSLLEAGLMECAIIATPKGGTEEVIIDSKHGTIVDGTVGSIDESLVALVGNEAKRKTQAITVRRRVEEYFEWGHVAKIVDREIREFDRKNG